MAEEVPPAAEALAAAEADLAASDEQMRAGRATRLVRLRAEGEPAMGRLFFGGYEASLAFHEASVAYVNGMPLACIVLVQVCLEHNLAGAFMLEGRDADARLPYHRMLTAGRASGFLTDDEHALFDRLRRSRNPIAHPRPIDDQSTLLRRAMKSGTPPDDLLDDDALEALLALVRLVNRPPFGVGE